MLVLCSNGLTSEKLLHHIGTYLHDCKLLHFDVVEFIGGNPYYLLDAIRRHHAEPVLQALARECCLIGWSAAAFVFGPTLALVDRYSP